MPYLLQLNHKGPEAAFEKEWTQSCKVDPDDTQSHVSASRSPLVIFATLSTLPIRGCFDTEMS